MKNSLLRIALSLTLLAAPSALLHAQSAEVTGGSVSITLDPTLWSMLDTHGIVTTLGPVMGNITHSDTILTGLFDTATGSGYFTTKGQMRFTGPDGRVVTVLQMGLDTTGPTPVIFGYVYADDYFYNKQPIFNILPPSKGQPAFKYCLLQPIPIQTTLSPYFAHLLDTSFKTSMLLNYKGITMVHFNVDLTPVP